MKLVHDALHAWFILYELTNSLAIASARDASGDDGHSAKNGQVDGHSWVARSERRSDSPRERMVAPFRLLRDDEVVLDAADSPHLAHELKRASSLVPIRHRACKGHFTGSNGSGERRTIHGRRVLEYGPDSTCHFAVVFSNTTDLDSVRDDIVDSIDVRSHLPCELELPQRVERALEKKDSAAGFHAELRPKRGRIGIKMGTCRLFECDFARSSGTSPAKRLRAGEPEHRSLHYIRIGRPLEDRADAIRVERAARPAGHGAVHDHEGGNIDAAGLRAASVRQHGKARDRWDDEDASRPSCDRGLHLVGIVDPTIRHSELRQHATQALREGALAQYENVGPLV